MFTILAPYEGWIVVAVAVIAAYKVTRWMLRQSRMARSQKAALKRLTSI